MQSCFHEFRCLCYRYGIIPKLGRMYPVDVMKPVHSTKYEDIVSMFESIEVISLHSASRPKSYSQKRQKESQARTRARTTKYSAVRKTLRWPPSTSCGWDENNYYYRLTRWVVVAFHCRTRRPWVYKRLLSCLVQYLLVQYYKSYELKFRVVCSTITNTTSGQSFIWVRVPHFEQSAFFFKFCTILVNLYIYISIVSHEYTKIR